MPAAVNPYAEQAKALADAFKACVNDNFIGPKKDALEQAIADVLQYAEKRAAATAERLDLQVKAQIPRIHAF